MIEALKSERIYFHVIIANSLLYHVENLHLALSEVKRVLKDQGTFYASTFSKNGMSKYIHQLLEAVGLASQKITYGFTLESGQKLLEDFSCSVNRIDREDCLKNYSYR